MAGRASPDPRISPRSGVRVGIIVARYHEPITEKLLDGALLALRNHGVPLAGITVTWVPGSFELPQAALALAKTGRFHALICLGVVIRGETPHFEHVARVAADGISHVGLVTGVPTSFGVITAENESQAWERAGGRSGNRGEDAALAALEMAQLAAKQAPARAWFGEPQPKARRARITKSASASEASPGARAQIKGSRRGRALRGR